MDELLGTECFDEKNAAAQPRPVPARCFAHVLWANSDGDPPAHEVREGRSLCNDVRRQLEPCVARLAAARAQRDDVAEKLLAAMEAEPVDIATWNASDRLFHRQLAAMTGNPVLLAFADHVATLMDQPLWQRLRDDSIASPGHTAIHLAEHRMIYEAVAEGDPDAASLYAAQHVKRVRRYMTLD